MLDITRYILGNFWHFLGFIVILGMLLKGLVALVAVVLNRKVDIS